MIRKMADIMLNVALVMLFILPILAVGLFAALATCVCYAMMMGTPKRRLTATQPKAML